MGARSYDPEFGRLSLALGDGRTVELVRLPQLGIEDGFALSIRSRTGQTEGRGFIQIDSALGVKTLQGHTAQFADSPGHAEINPQPAAEVHAPAAPEDGSPARDRRPGHPEPFASPEPASLELAGPESPPVPQTEPGQPTPAAANSADRLYAPLRAAFDPEYADQFAWVAETDTIQTYEHRQTLRYIHIDGAPARFGQFYDQSRTPIDREAALQHALPAEPAQASAPAASPAASQQADTQNRPQLQPAAPPPPAEVGPPAEAGPQPADEPGFDTFTRRQRERGEHDSWRERIAELSRIWRLSRTAIGRKEHAEE